MKIIRRYSVALLYVLFLALISTTNTKAASNDFEIDSTGALVKYHGSDENVIIPAGVITIKENVFDGIIKSLTIPNTVTTIENLAFCGLQFTTITLPESVSYLGDGAFEACWNLESVLIYNDNITIKGKIFPLPIDTVLYGHKGSATEAYALKNNYNFKSLDELEKPLINISLQKTNITLNVGKSTLNHVIYHPDDTMDDKTVVWSSSNPAIARVLSNGKIQALSPGTVTITAAVGNLTATCTVVVNEI